MHVTPKTDVIYREMLAALESLLEWADATEQGDFASAWTQARFAVAKAKRDAFSQLRAETPGASGFDSADDDMGDTP